MSSGVHSIKATKFTEEEIAEMKSLFDTIDTDGSGGLDLDEVTNFLKMAELPEELAQLVFFLFDGDEKNGITFEAFKGFFDLLEKIADDPFLAFKALFDKIDKDHSGEIDKPELKRFVEILGIPMTDDELNALFAEVDTDHSGSLSFDEVKNILELE